MAGFDLDRIIEISEKVDKAAGSNRKPQTNPTPQSRPNNEQQQRYLTPEEFERIRSGGKEEHEYNARDDIKRMNEARVNGFSTEKIEHSGLPSSIAQSFKKNPLVFDPMIAQKMSGKGSAFDKLASVTVNEGGKSAHEKMMELMENQEKLEQREAEVAASRFKNKTSTPAYSVNESNASPQQIMSGPINYELIQMIVEKAVERQLGLYFDRIYGNSNTEA